MYKRQFLRDHRLILIGMMLVMMAATGGRAATLANRLTMLDKSTSAEVGSSVHPLALLATDLGSVPDSMQLNGMTMHFQRSPRQQAALLLLIEQQQDPSSPMYHQWLTPQSFATRFGMSAQDLATATAWLRSQGFNVVAQSQSGNAITFSGTAAQARSALGTEIHRFTLNGETHFANTSAVVLPTALAAVVSSVSGLDDFAPKPRGAQATATPASTGPHPLFSSWVGGTHWLSPGDVSTIYDIAPLYGSGYTGAGQIIGVAGQSDIVPADIAAFRAAAGLPASPVTVILANGSGDPGIIYSNGDLTQAEADLEWAGGIAYGANLVYIVSDVSANGAFNSLIYGISNSVPVNSQNVLIPILLMTYGACEAHTPPSTFNTLEAYLQQAAAQGQTVIAASGNTGAADCDEGGTLSSHGLAVDYPASSAYVTAVGGTEFNEGNADGVTSYWSYNSSTDIVSSVKSYLPEVAWNDSPTASQAGANGLIGGGGGVSAQFAKPSWQAGVPGIPADGQRDVPDISLDASGAHDPYLMCSQVVVQSTGQYATSCSNNSFRLADYAQYSDNGELMGYGGTAPAAAIFAGMVGLFEQKMQGSSLGVLNKQLYTAAANPATYASAFHDITSGNNQMPCGGGTGCANGVVGYIAGTGYDLATGLGSVDAAVLATSVTSSGKIGSRLSLAYSPVPPVIGQTVSFTATVTGSDNGTPTGTVTFSFDGVAGSPVALSGASASATFAFVTGGTHVAKASYSGDATYNSSISIVTLRTFADAPGAVVTSTKLTSSSGTNPLFLYNYPAPTFMAVVASNTEGSLGGTVTFSVGNGSSSVNTSVAMTGCQPTYCVVFFSPAGGILPVNGFNVPMTTVSSHYDGNTSFQQSASNALMLPTSNQTFLLLASPVAVTQQYQQGQALPVTGTSQITVQSLNGFADQVKLTATTSCPLFSPGDTVQAVANGNVSVNLTISTGCLLAAPGAAGAKFARNSSAGVERGGGALLALLCLAGCLARRRRGLSSLAGLLAVVLAGGLLAGISGCGWGIAPVHSISGNYQVTVTGTDVQNIFEPVQSTTFEITVK